MTNSKRIAGLLGPTIVAMIVSEFPLVQPHLYDAQIPPVVYLSGVLMFVGGLAIVRAHNHWMPDWTVLVTLSGWFFLALGLFRMFAASMYQRGSANESRLSCGRNARRRKAVEPQKKRPASEATQFFPPERPPASSAC
ncbi:MAG TPA: hypothetical protein VNH14_12325 [Gemmatimonadales bacterium]|nr:hypothetical protein [Gemmatimonadales bacterium]